jgi:antitoxin (DNA-binding transcriptional repressor) of toxin-antitoxin stability system
MDPSYLVVMPRVDLKTLQNELGELAAQGETVLITDGDRVVAELVRPRSARAAEISDERSVRMDDAIPAGSITPAALPPGPPPQAPRIARLVDILSELDADRRER